jgi:hypothetical protein
VRLLALTIVAASLSGCGDSGDEAPPATPAATTSSFKRADLYREVPRDVCRQEDPAFVEKLIGRIDRALPNGAKGSAHFEEFFVQTSPDGKGEQAVLRFTARHGDDAAASMFAMGSFSKCTVGPMRASIGRDLFLDDGKQSFMIP